MNKQNMIYAALVVASLVIGAAYGDRIPLVKQVYPRLPGSRA